MRTSSLSWRYICIVVNIALIRGRLRALSSVGVALVASGGDLACVGTLSSHGGAVLAGDADKVHSTGAAAARHGIVTLVVSSELLLIAWRKLVFIFFRVN